MIMSPHQLRTRPGGGRAVAASEEVVGKDGPRAPVRLLRLLPPPRGRAAGAPPLSRAHGDAEVLLQEHRAHQPTREGEED